MYQFFNNNISVFFAVVEPVNVPLILFVNVTYFIAVEACKRAVNSRQRDWYFQALLLCGIP